MRNILFGVVRLLLSVAFLAGNVLCNAEPTLNYTHVMVDGSIVASNLESNCYNTIDDALNYVLAIGIQEPVTIYVAPGEYSISGIHCNNVIVQGLSESPESVRISCRSSFRGNDITIRNVVIDDCLEGDKVFYSNCIVNTRPTLFKEDETARRLYEKCVFDCGNESLRGTATYVDCTFSLYGPYPISHSPGNGTFFLGCRFVTYFSDVLYLTGAGSVSLVGCDFEGDTPDVFWMPNLKPYSRFYQDRVTLRGREYLVSLDSLVSVDMSGQRVADAYSYSYKHKIYYNILNLMQGNDGWDPMGQTDVCRAAELFFGRQLRGLATTMSMTPPSVCLDRNNTSALFIVNGVQPIGWLVTDSCLSVSSLDGIIKVARVDSSVSCNAMLEIYSQYGLQAAASIKVTADERRLVTQKTKGKNKRKK